MNKLVGTGARDGGGEGENNNNKTMRTLNKC